MYQEKTYHLRTSWQSLLIIPGVILALLPISLFVIYGTRSNTLAELIYVFGFILGLAALPIFYGLTSQLVTTQLGIKNYFFYPFYVLIPWDQLISIQRGVFGNVLLVVQTQSSSDWKMNIFSQTIALDSFISDWQNSEFIQDLRYYAPQVVIPVNVFPKKKTPIFYRTGNLLLYFVGSIGFLLIPSIILPKDIIEPVKFAWDFAIFGFLGGALGGMAGLLQYSLWLRNEPDETSIKRVAILLYLTPFCAWMVIFFIGTAFHLLTGYETSKNMQGTINLVSFWFGFVQFKILQQVFLGAKSMSNS